MSSNDKLYEVQFDVVLYKQVENAELDEMRSFVYDKENQRWLWLVVNHDTGDILAYTFGKRKDEVFEELQDLLQPFGITMFYTDNCGSYSRNINHENLTVTKKNTQTIERKNLTLRSRIKRLTRKTICFSKTTKMHDIVIDLFVNILEFSWCVHLLCQYI